MKTNYPGMFYRYAKKIYSFLYYDLYKGKCYNPLVSYLTDIYVISFPKCGRTWLNFFLAEYFSKKYGVDNSLELSGIFKKHPRVPRIGFNHGGARPDSIEELKEIQENFRDNKVIFLVRDPRDVVVSYYHQLNERRPNFSSDNFADVKAMSKSDFIRSQTYGIEWIVTYMNQWYQQREAFKGFHLIRYEDMHENPTDTFACLLEFIGEENISNTSLEYAIEASSFDNMRKVEESEKLDDSRLQPADKDNPDSYKVRKGQVGGYTDELSEEDIAYVDKAIAHIHPDFGYR